MTHPEPRVEWEVVLGDKPGLWYKLKHNGKTERMGCPDNLKELGRYLTRAFNDFLSHSVQEAKAERVAEIENSKIISSIGYRPSKFRGLSAVAIYNMALDDLLASLKQEEEA